MTRYTYYDNFMYKFLKFLSRIYIFPIDDPEEEHHPDIKDQQSYFQDAIYAFILLKSENFTVFGSSRSEKEDNENVEYHSDAGDLNMKYMMYVHLYKMDSVKYDEAYEKCLRCFRSKRDTIIYHHAEPLYFNVWWPDEMAKILGVGSIHDRNELRKASRHLKSYINFRAEHLNLERTCKRYLQKYVWEIVNKDGYLSRKKYMKYVNRFLQARSVIDELPLPKGMKEFLLRKESAIPLYIIIDKFASVDNIQTIPDFLQYYKNETDNPFFR